MADDQQSAAPPAPFGRHVEQLHPEQASQPVGEQLPVATVPDLEAAGEGDNNEDELDSNSTHGASASSGGLSVCVSTCYAQHRRWTATVPGSHLTVPGRLRRQ